MSDNKLGQALEEIIRDQRTAKRVTDRRAPNGAPRAPAGGIQKSQPRAPKRVQPTRAATFNSDSGETRRPARYETSKVLVSNLPPDVTESMVKEYFNETVGHVRRVEVEYNRDGSSKGKAEILFGTAKGADICFEKLNTLPIDGRPIRVEIITAQPTHDQPKSLSERAGQPKKEKVQPKSAVDNKRDQAKNARGGVQPGKNGVRKPQQTQNGKAQQRPRSSRPAPKTMEELDSEMADYFVNVPETDAAGGDAAAAPPAAAVADDAMEDEIS